MRLRHEPQTKMKSQILFRTNKQTNKQTKLTRTPFIDIKVETQASTAYNVSVTRQRTNEIVYDEEYLYLVVNTQRIGACQGIKVRTVTAGTKRKFARDGSHGLDPIGLCFDGRKRLPLNERFLVGSATTHPSRRRKILLCLCCVRKIFGSLCSRSKGEMRYLNA